MALALREPEQVTHKSVLKHVIDIAKYGTFIAGRPLKIFASCEATKQTTNRHVAWLKCTLLLKEGLDLSHGCRSGVTRFLARRKLLGCGSFNCTKVKGKILRITTHSEFEAIISGRVFLGHRLDGQPGPRPKRTSWSRMLPPGWRKPARSSLSIPAVLRRWHSVRKPWQRWYLWSRCRGFGCVVIGWTFHHD